MINERFWEGKTITILKVLDGQVLSNCLQLTAHVSVLDTKSIQYIKYQEIKRRERKGAK